MYRLVFETSEYLFGTALKRLWDVFAAFLGCLGRSWDALGESEGPQVEDKSSKNRVSKSSLKNLRIEMRWAQRKSAEIRVPGSREIRPACKGESTLDSPPY